tara:strand:+ start:9805 stop:10155 length:351 start_codon:yes stop_codon:yes gene_type:complete
MAESFGKHVTIDMIVKNPKLLESVEEVTSRIERVVKEHVTILSRSFHDFGPDCGVTCIWLLAESHISFHSWPEKSYAALDIFTCGDVQPMDFVQPILDEFDSLSSNIGSHLRKKPA